MVRYEDLEKDCRATLTESLYKQGIEYEEEKLNEVIERQSFKNRKAQFQKSNDNINIKFLRQGISGDWKRFLDKDLLSRIERGHGETMRQMGYEI